MIDESTIKLLSPQQQMQAREFEKLFAMSGWREILSYLQKAHDASVLRCLNAQTWADNRFHKGAAAAYLDMLGAEDRLATTLAQTAEANQAAKVQAEVDDEENYE